MEQRGLRILNCIRVKRHFSVFLFLAVFFVMHGYSWSVCYDNQNKVVKGISDLTGGETCSTNGLTVSGICSASYAAYNCASKYLESNRIYVKPTKTSYSNSVYSANGSYWYCSSNTCLGSNILDNGYMYVDCTYSTYCTTQCGADSVLCINSGKFWNSDQCVCESSCSECDAYEQACESEGGNFSGTCTMVNGSRCCQGVCNVCSGNAMKNLYQMKVNVCCQQGLAPPDFAQVCFTQGIGQGCGVEWSKYADLSSGEWACRSPGLSVEAASLYNQLCFNSSSSTAGSSSGGTSSEGGGNSEGGGSSGEIPPYPEGCDECPWLDSILDTLTAQKGIVEDIKACVLFPSLCGAESEDLPQIDTSILPYLRPFMDSTVSLSREQIELLADLDTNMLKILDSLSNFPKSDTAVVRAINGASSTIDGKLSTVNASIVHMNDSTKKWLRMIADSIGISADSIINHLDSIKNRISADSIINHLDSIKNRIPKDILDSILKYQKLASESDSIAVTVDMSSIDSLIDSTVSYFNRSLLGDSLRGEKLNDSLAVIHDAILDVPYRMYQLLGYGDTASKTLRNNIEDVYSAVNEYRDSALKYFGLFGDSMAAINGALGELIAKFSPGVIDTNGLGVWASYVRSGENMGDSIVRSYGWQNLKNLNVDSNYSAALAGFSNKTDSVSAVVNDSLSNRAARLKDSLVRKNDSLKRSLPDTLTKYADSLVIWAPFADFDSIIYSTIGTRIPNRDDCPEDCQSWSVSIPVIGLVNYTVDYGLCLGRASLGNLSVLAFLKLLIRIIVAITCVMIIYRTLVAIK